MVDRRSMGDALALNPDKLAFIHGEKTVVDAGRGAEKIQATERSGGVALCQRLRGDFMTSGHKSILSSLL
jgi:hypothetical protein